MPLFLTNDPATFQCVLTHILQPHVNSFVLVYLNDILVISCTEEEHLKHRETVCSLLAEHNVRYQAATQSARSSSHRIPTENTSDHWITSCQP